MRKLRTALSMLFRDPAEFVRYVFRVRHWVVFFADPADIAAPTVPEGALMRPLGDAELDDAVTALPGLPESDVSPAEYRSKQFERAYGVFVGGRLGHISCVITPERERRDTPVRLQPGEVEITFCFTPPDFRGRGLYPYAVRTLCRELAQRGVRRVLMKTSAANRASQRGIQNAGLVRCGRLVSFSSALLGDRSINYRGFRRRLRKLDRIASARA